MFLLGVERPGQIRLFDDKGEIIEESKFDPGMTYGSCETQGGIRMAEVGNRGTKYGLNM